MRNSYFVEMASFWSGDFIHNGRRFSLALSSLSLNQFLAVKLLFFLNISSMRIKLIFCKRVINYIRWKLQGLTFSHVCVPPAPIIPSALVRVVSETCHLRGEKGSRYFAGAQTFICVRVRAILHKLKFWRAPLLYSGMPGMCLSACIAIFMQAVVCVSLRRSRQEGGDLS